MIFFAFLYRVRGATRNPKMPFALMSEPEGTPGRPSRGGTEIDFIDHFVSAEEGCGDIEDSSWPSFAGCDARAEVKAELKNISASVRSPPSS